MQMPRALQTILWIISKMQSSKSESRWKRIVSKRGLASPNGQSFLLITEGGWVQVWRNGRDGSRETFKMTDYAKELEKVFTIVFHFSLAEFPVFYKLQWSRKLWQVFPCPNVNQSFGGFCLFGFCLRTKPFFLIWTYFLLCVFQNYSQFYHHLTNVE